MGHHTLLKEALPSAAPHENGGQMIDLADSKALRGAFGAFGTGVTIVTTMTPIGPLAMTANSFSSVSLTPPLVLWSAACRSLRHDSFANAAYFTIHVLAEDQRSQAMAFAAQGNEFGGTDWSLGPTGTPTLTGSLATFHCKAFATHPAGDHSVIIGQITHAHVADNAAQGLMFAKGKFGRFEPHSE